MDPRQLLVRAVAVLAAPAVVDPSARLGPAVEDRLEPLGAEDLPAAVADPVRQPWAGEVVDLPVAAEGRGLQWAAEAVEVPAARRSVPVVVAAVEDPPVVDLPVAVVKATAKKTDVSKPELPLQ